MIEVKQLEAKRAELEFSIQRAEIENEAQIQALRHEHTMSRLRQESEMLQFKKQQHELRASSPEADAADVENDGVISTAEKKCHSTSNENTIVVRATSSAAFKSNKELRAAIIDYVTAKDPSVCPSAIKYGYPMNAWNVSRVTDFSRVFSNLGFRVTKLTTQRLSEFNENVGDWDVSNGTNFNSMFFSCNVFNHDLSKWDVSKGEDFSDMFSYCQKFNQDLSQWDVSKASDMFCMFQNCKELNCDLSAWRNKIVSRKCNFGDMFEGSGYRFDRTIWR